MKNIILRKYIAIGLLIGGGILFISIPLFDRLEGSIKRGVGSITASFSFWISKGGTLFSPPGEHETVNSLREERNKLIASEIEKTGIVEENKKLQNLLSFREKQSQPFLGAHVLGRSTDPGRSMLILDRGSDDGVKKGFPVVAESGVLIGKIASTESKTSYVRLLNDPNSKTIALYTTKDGRTIQGLIEGKFRTGLELTLVPTTDPGEQGLALFTSGLEEHVPRGLLIGIITDISARPTDLFHTIKLKPAVRPDSVTVVGVLL